MFVCTTVLYEYMTSFRNDVNNLFDITHVRIKIYGELYHCIIYITFAEVMLELLLISDID